MKITLLHLLAIGTLVSASQAFSLGLAQADTLELDCEYKTCSMADVHGLQYIENKTVEITETPLPSSVALLGLGLFALGCCKRKKS